MTPPVSADDERRVVDEVNTDLLVGGVWRAASGGDSLDVTDPSTGAVLARVADATLDDARDAIELASESQDAWGATAPRERGEILRKAFELMVERADDLALLMTLEMGKPLAESRAEVLYAADYFRWFSEEAVRLTGSWRTAPDGQSRLLVMKQPVGPCLLVTPWNFPLAMGTRKIGPALAAGNTVIVKPAKQTPLSMLALGGILIEAGLPRGVLSVLTTSNSSALVGAIMADSRLRKLSFTGSTEVGIALLEQAAPGLLRTSMELGGNAPFIVFDDADLELAADEAMRAKLRNNGEACTAANRFYVQDGVAEAFVAALTERFSRIVTGRGVEDGVTLGPLIDRPAVDKVDELVQAALEDGATIAYEGEAPAGTGTYYPPTLLSDVPADSRIVHEEIFGPIASVVRFSTEEEVLRLANASQYGLASYVFTENLDRAIRVSERLEVGMVGLNRGVLSNVAAPFGGIKASGFGREGGDVGIDEYLAVKYVSVGVAGP